MKALLLKLVAGTGGMWILAVAAIALLAIGGVAGRYSAAVTVANAKTATAQCGEARANDNAFANLAGAEAVSGSAGRAAAADDRIAAQEGKRASGYATARTEANNALSPVSGTVPVRVDVRPLRILFDRMRDADAAAAGAHRDGVSSPAVDDVPSPGADP